MASSASIARHATRTRTENHQLHTNGPLPQTDNGPTENQTMSRRSQSPHSPHAGRARTQMLLTRLQHAYATSFRNMETRSFMKTLTCRALAVSLGRTSSGDSSPLHMPLLLSLIYGRLPSVLSP